MNYSESKGVIFSAAAGLVVVVIFLGLVYYVKHPAAPADKTPTPPKVEVKTDNPNITVTPTDTTSQAEVVKAVIKTAKGDLNLELYPKVAPKTVANFVKLAKAGFYDGTTFHRVVADFVIQGGDPLSKDPKTLSQAGTGGPGYQFEDEINPKSLGLSDDAIKTLEGQGYKYSPSLQSLPLVTGVLAMANSGPNTNGSQFFVVIGPDPSYLNGKHTVFGKLTQGLDIAKKIVQGEVMQKVTIEGN